jgi:hypothetical protein
MRTPPASSSPGAPGGPRGAREDYKKLAKEFEEKK